jgi:hypothetical protein
VISFTENVAYASLVREARGRSDASKIIRLSRKLAAAKKFAPKPKDKVSYVKDQSGVAALDPDGKDLLCVCCYEDKTNKRFAVYSCFHVVC